MKLISLNPIFFFTNNYSCVCVYVHTCAMYNSLSLIRRLLIPSSWILSAHHHAWLFTRKPGIQTQVCSASALPTKLPPQLAQVENTHKHGLSPVRLPWGWSQSVPEMYLVWYLLFNKCTPSPGACVKYIHKCPSTQKPLGQYTI